MDGYMAEAAAEAPTVYVPYNAAAAAGVQSALAPNEAPGGVGAPEASFGFGFTPLGAPSARQVSELAAIKGMTVW